MQLDAINLESVQAHAIDVPTEPCTLPSSVPFTSIMGGAHISLVSLFLSAVDEQVYTGEYVCRYHRVRDQVQQNWDHPISP